MSMPGLKVFDATLQKTYQWLNELMQLLDWGDKNKAYLALRATLHELRDCLTTQEVAQLAAQLPMLVRGFYYEGWNPAGKPEKERSEEQFLAHIARYFQDAEDVNPERVARAVFTVLANHVSEGEIEDVRQVLPSGVRRLWPPPAHASE
ncbi:MAG: hypothetical protein QOI59_6379 [Gammaproteobacteria bacterium]|jgi:uncharacterized protein (DUF2267 family)|nr:hypothetical protein [Gammaproteobacteria bacterium]